MADTNVSSSQNTRTGDTSSGDAVVVPMMLECEDCGKLVSEMSMTMHKICACQARARRPPAEHANANANASSSNSNINDAMEVEEILDDSNSSEAYIVSVAAAAADDDGMDTHTESDDPGLDIDNTHNDGPEAIVVSGSSTVASPRRRNGNRVLPTEYYESARGEIRRRRRRLSPTQQQQHQKQEGISHVDDSDDEDDDDDDILQVSDVVDLVNSPELPSQRQTTHEEEEDDDGGGDKAEWACPQCTLLNPLADATCAACHYRNRERASRARSERERLMVDVDVDVDVDESSNNMSPLTLVSGGALLGGMLGAAGSLMNGRDLLSSAAEGAMTGVVGGAFLQEVLRSPNHLVSSTASVNDNRNNDIANARSSAAMGIAGYPSLSANNNNGSSSNRRARPRSSYRVVQRQAANGMTTTIISGGNGSTRIERRASAPAGINDPMLSLLVHSYLQQQGGGGVQVGHHGLPQQQNQNVDGMDYDQLLHAFGDGSDNLGAEERQIQQLPTKVIGDYPETELPEDARHCLICLEDFQSGETRKTLPCLHGFHQQCADKWLRTNGSCPICKHRLS